MSTSQNAKRFRDILATIKHNFHASIYTLVLPIARLAAKLQMGFVGVRAPKIPGPYIVLINHLTDWDPILVATSFDQHMYFVASEHVFRWGWISSIISALTAPIPRVKGSYDLNVVQQIIAKIRNRHNVAIFAEGSATWNGRSAPIHPTTAKLIRFSKATLVTYRLQGGYFTAPRWGKHYRKGRMSGEIVNIYTPEQLQSMTVQEIHDAITADIREDAYVRQETVNHDFKGTDIAESLEYTLYICPKCKAVGKLTSHGVFLTCGNCGLNVRFTTKGYLEPVGDEPEFTFRRIYEWDNFQQAITRETVARALETGNTSILYRDECDVILRKIDTERHKTTIAATGPISMSIENFTIGDVSFKMTEISDMGIVGKQILVFSIGKDAYQTRSASIYCARKYLILFEAYRERMKQIHSTRLPEGN